MSALLLKLAPWLAGAALIFGGGWYAGGLQPKAALARLQAADWQAKAQGEAAARKAVEDQLAKAQATSANNSTVIEKLQNENAQIASDHDATLTRVRRLEQLLVLASRSSSGSDHLPKTGSGQGTPAAGDPPGTPPIEGLLVAAATECEQTANQLNALISEIEPQL